MTRRKEHVWSLQENRLDYKDYPHRQCDVELTFTQRGIEVNAWYDGSVSIGPTVLIPWDKVLAWRAEVEEVGP